MTGAALARKLPGFMASAPASGTVPAIADARPSPVPRALRVWAVSDVIYGAAVAALAVVAVPWKSPAANLLVLGYTLSLIGVAPFLYRGRHWAHRIAVVTALVGLLAAVLVAVALVVSWAYLRASYGAFGAGASLGALLIAGIVIEVLAVYPALRLHGLLRREVRLAIAGSRAGNGEGSRAPVVAVLVMVLLPLPVGAGVYLRHRISPQNALDAATATAVLAQVRASLTAGTPTPGADTALAVLAATKSPSRLFVTLWEDGRIVARAEGEGPSIADAAALAGRRLRAALDQTGQTEAASRGRLKLDRVVGRSPVVTWSPLAFALALDPGLDGLVDADERLVFLGDDVLRAGVAGTSAPLAFLDELRAGIDVGWMERRIRETSARGPFARIRTEGWVESQRGTVRVHRGNVSVPATPQSAAIAGGDYLLRQVQSDGRFRYRYQPYDDVAFGDGSDYSLARHAGAAYCFAQLFAVTADVRFADGAQQALAWLSQQVLTPCGPHAGTACLEEGGRVAFGPSALAAIAMFEYQRRTGDARYQELASGLVTFLSSLQRPDGSFDHAFDRARGVAVTSAPRLFASEQAALALVLADRVVQRPGARAAAERALDQLTRAKYDFFLGRFIYGADHWTCIAAEEAWPAIRHRHYWDFCRGYAAFMRRLQYPPAPGSAPQDFAGHFGFGYQLVPQAPATAGFTEALLSTLALARHHGAAADDAWLAADARAALEALLREQLSSDNNYLAGSPARAAGGFRRSTVEPEIRIDFVQHATSALARAQALGLGQALSAL